MAPLSWAELTALAAFEPDPVHGATNAQSRLRLFGRPEAEVRVTLYRDHHAWCPYCQKVWLWLEEKQVPYRIEKVTMFCYGTKESWYTRKVPSGMLPAVALDGRLLTESDDILLALEQTFGPLGWGMNDPAVLPLRRLERQLFRAWCGWLCYPARTAAQDQEQRQSFTAVMAQVEEVLAQTPGGYFLADFSTADVIFAPYLERMHASLYYYKGYALRQEHGRLADWLTAMETRLTYRGTQGDFHTHAHDLPPQMGGCFANRDPQTALHQQWVDRGPWLELPDATYPEPAHSRQEALFRVIKHHRAIIRVNPAPAALMDEALRCALTTLITGEACLPPPGADQALRYLRDRISVPRDMSIYAAKRLRQALEQTAALVGDHQGSPLPRQHRRDQDPAQFAQIAAG
ncbi:MAG: glutathione S-transferase family protein [Synechococcales cyanobacterium]